MTRVSLLLLSWSVVLFAHATQTGYPLAQTNERGLIQQVPLSFWAAMGLAIGALALLALTARTVYSVPLLLWIFYLVFHSKQLLYYNVLMGDNTTVSRWNALLGQRQSLPTAGSAQYFDYLQWPLHHANTMIVQNVFDTSVMTTIEVGLFAYVSVFSLGVFFFVYVHRDVERPFFFFAGGALYLLITWYVLNNQFVPQFLALIILVFLVACHMGSGKRWLLLRLILFFALVMAHPFLYIFYVVAILLAPLVEAGKSALVEQFGGDRSVAYSSLFLFGSAGSILRAWIRFLPRAYSSWSWVSWTLTLGSVYVSFLAYRFVSFQFTVFYKVSTADPDISRTPLGLLSDLLPAPVRDALPFLGGSELETSSVSTVLLYELVPENLHFLTRNGSIVVVVTVLGLLVLSQLYKTLKRVAPMDIALLSAGGVYFLVGSVLPLLANRALQVIFLPLVTATDVLRTRPVISRLLIVLLLVASPILVVNAMVNQSVSAGGNSEDFHTSEAGISLVDMAAENVIVHTENSLPLKSRDDVKPSEDVMKGFYNVSSGDIMIRSPVVEQYIRHHGYECHMNSSRSNVVYDNSATGVWVHRDDVPYRCTVRS